MPSSEPALINVGAVQSPAGRWHKRDHKCAPACHEHVRCLAFFKKRKSAQHLLARPMMTWQFMAVHSHEYCVALMCAVLEGSMSGYSAWRKREPGRHRREGAFLAEKIAEAFQHHRRFLQLFYATPSLTAFSALFT